MNAFTRALASRLLSPATPRSLPAHLRLPATPPLHFSSNLPLRLHSSPTALPLSPSTPLRDYFRSQRPFSSSTSRSGIRSYYGQQRGGGRGGSGWRRKIDGVPNEWILYGIIGTNVVVYGAWTYGGQLALKYRDPSWLRLLNDNFTSSLRNLKEGRMYVIFSDSSGPAMERGAEADHAPWRPAGLSLPAASRTRAPATSS